MQYLTEKLSEYWKKWVNFSEEAVDTIASGGYYSVKILNNLRLISFNSNYGWVWGISLIIIIIITILYCHYLRYIANLFALLNDGNKHYHTQWQWMIDELTSAKQKGEKVSERAVTQAPDKRVSHLSMSFPTSGGLKLSVREGWS